jgi:hypothetical protein
MRSPDRPEAAGLRRDTLAARLLRLPDAHPSSLRGDGAEGDRPREAADNEPWWPADQAAEPEDAAGAEEADYADYADDAADDVPGPDATADQAEPGQPGVDRPAGSGPERRAAGRTGGCGIPGAGREPYRPWFADGDGGADPWFADGV